MNKDVNVEYLCKCGEVIKCWYDHEKLNLFICDCGEQYVVQHYASSGYANKRFIISKLVAVVKVSEDE